MKSWEFSANADLLMLLVKLAKFEHGVTLIWADTMPSGATIGVGECHLLATVL